MGGRYLSERVSRQASVDVFVASRSRGADQRKKKKEAVPAPSPLTAYAQNRIIASESMMFRACGPTLDGSKPGLLHAHGQRMT